MGGPLICGTANRTCRRWAEPRGSARRIPEAPDALQGVIDILAIPELAFCLLAVGLLGVMVWLATPGMAASGAAGALLLWHCCISEEEASVTVDCARSDGERQLGERSREPMPRVYVSGKLVVAAANILDEGVADADHPCLTELFETAHRS